MCDQNHKRQSVSAVVLAAGQGTRMRSDLPKVLHPLAGEPMILHILRKLRSIPRVKQILLVIKHQASLVAERVRDCFPEEERIQYVLQGEENGTASAVASALVRVTQPHVLILCGDAPLIRKSTIDAVLDEYFKEDSAGLVVSALRNEPNDLGRICRDSRGNLTAICEKGSGPAYRQSCEVNSGMYCYPVSVLRDTIPKIAPNTKKNEYYLTDMVRILAGNGKRLTSFVVPDYREILGVNTVDDLYQAEKIILKYENGTASFPGPDPEQSP
ncbi:MAG: NTP transferase domain-containing protein [Candidatus Omnitrophica bacterium]|nr:NTP transferase domain-containing protein [Candidatus Omnitrophota bacterium]